MDVIVGTALMLILFLALFGILRASLLVSSLARAKAGATTVAETQIEYMRSLTYDSLGTVGGIPSGVVSQNATTTANGMPYEIHSFIQYVDDAADGTGAGDTNGITADYKRAEVIVSYDVSGQERTVSLASNFAPPGIETAAGGGTLTVDVLNAANEPVAGAAVIIINTDTNPSVNLSTFTDTGGRVSLPGATPSPEYRVSISKFGYSSAETYARDTTNQNPNPGYLTVAEDQTTVGTFAIDLLATLTLATEMRSGTTTVPLPNVSFTLTGEKTIGSTGEEDPLYKTVITDSTGGDASLPLTLEWDTYTPAVTGYDISDTCPPPPYAIAPGTTPSVSLILSPATANSLRVFVSDSAGTAVSGASVTLARTGFSGNVTSSSCGGAYFGGITSAGDYTLTILKTGYTTAVFTEVSVSGSATYGASFP